MADRRVPWTMRRTPASREAAYAVSAARTTFAAPANNPHVVDFEQQEGVELGTFEFVVNCTHSIENQTNFVAAVQTQLKAWMVEVANRANGVNLNNNNNNNNNNNVAWNNNPRMYALVKCTMYDRGWDEDTQQLNGNAPSNYRSIHSMVFDGHWATQWTGYLARVIRPDFQTWKRRGGFDHQPQWLTDYVAGAVNTIRFLITPMSRRGGCHKGTSPKNLEVNGVFLLSVPSKDNECLVACMCRATGRNNHNRVVSIGLRDFIRSNFKYTPPHIGQEGGWPVEALPYVASFFECKIVLLGDFGKLQGEYVPVALSDSGFGDTDELPVVTLMLHDHHYYLVQNKKAKTVACKQCRNKISGSMAQHLKECKAKKCPNCPTWFTDTHTQCNTARADFVQAKKDTDAKRLYSYAKWHVPELVEAQRLEKMAAAAAASGNTTEDSQQQQQQQQQHDYIPPTPDTPCTPSQQDSEQDEDDRIISNDPGITNISVHEADIGYFDCETYRDPETNIHHPYLVGWWDSYGRTMKHAWGPNCMRDFADYMKASPVKEGCKTTWIGYNTSRYDTNLLLRQLLSETEDVKFTMNGGRIIKMETKTIRIWDLCCFTSCPLADACKDFKAPASWYKTVFPHKFIRSYEDLDYVGAPPAYPDYYYRPDKVDKSLLPDPNKQWSLKEVCNDYIRRDVLSTRFVYLKLASIVYDKVRLRITDFITTSQMAYSIWNCMSNPEHPLYTCNREKYVDTWPFSLTPPGHRVNVPDKYAHLRPLPYLPRSKFYIEIADEEKHNFIKQAVYGGRVYPIKREFKSSHYEELMSGTMTYDQLTDDYVMNFDVVSLYPTAMKEGKYPVGRSVWLSQEKLHEHEKKFNSGTGDEDSLPTGFYQAYFTAPKNLVVPVLPKKKWVYKDKKAVVSTEENECGLKWDLHDDCGVYTSVELIQARKAGYTFKFARGLHYPSGAAHIFKDYIDFMWAVKEKGEKEGNEVLRNFGKLSLNALYGKTLQQPIVDNIKLVRKRADFMKFLLENELDDYVFLDNEMGTVILKGTRKNEAACITKPSQMGAYVLSHSRRIMDKYIGIIDPNRFTDPVASLDTCQLYGDTDSLHTHIAKVSDMERIAPHIAPNTLGKLSNDYKKKGEAKVIRSIYLEPKTYAVTLWKNDNTWENVLKCKGVPNHLVTMQHYENALLGNRVQSVRMEMIKKVGARNHFRWVDASVETEQNAHRVVDEMDATVETEDKPATNKKQKLEYAPFEMYSVQLDKVFCGTQWKGRQRLPDGVRSVPLGFDEMLLPQHMRPVTPSVTMVDSDVSDEDNNAQHKRKREQDADDELLGIAQ